MAKEEHDKVIRELNLVSKWLAIKRMMVVAKASLAAKSTCLNKSMAESTKSAFN